MPIRNKPNVAILIDALKHIIKQPITAIPKLIVKIFFREVLPIKKFAIKFPMIRPTNSNPL